MKKVNEGSDGLLRIRFYDAGGPPVIPKTCTYTVRDAVTGEVLVSPTDIPSLSETVELVIPRTAHAVRRGRNALERRVLTVRYTYGEQGQRVGTAEHLYTVRNLVGIPMEGGDEADL